MFPAHWLAMMAFSGDLEQVSGFIVRGAQTLGFFCTATV